jgi:hypothetical protein
MVARIASCTPHTRFRLADHSLSATQHRNMADQMAHVFTMPRQRVTKDMYRRSPSGDEGSNRKRVRASKPKVKSGKALHVTNRNVANSGCYRMFHLQGTI